MLIPIAPRIDWRLEVDPFGRSGSRELGRLGLAD